MGIDPKDIPKMATDAGELLENFVSAFINFSKPLICVVNGPAVGVSVTTMALFDIVYATDKVSNLSLSLPTPIISNYSQPHGQGLSYCIFVHFKQTHAT